jgi:hypothetical protein
MGCSEPDQTSWLALDDAASFGFGDAASPAGAAVFDEAHAPAAHAIIPTSPERIDGMSPALEFRRVGFSNASFIWAGQELVKGADAGGASPLECL